MAKSGTTENEFRYVGEQWDPNAGFYYLRARWMDPRTGRFVSVDPFVGDPQAPVSLHRYLYANASPVNYTDPTGLFSLGECMAAVGISNILAVNVIPTTFMKKTFSLIIYMTDYYSTGPDGIKHTKDDEGIIPFPSGYYAPFLTNIEAAFAAENQKSNKVKFQLVNSIGMKSEVSSTIGLSRYSAILSHSSASFGALFPSLSELKNYGLGAEHITKSELNYMGSKGNSKGVYLAACNAGWWANGVLSAESKSSTEISALLVKAVSELKKASQTY